MTKKIFLPLLAIFLFIFAVSAHAQSASLYFSSTRTTTFEPGVDQEIDIIVDSVSTPFSAFNATLTYPASLITVNSVEPTAALSTVLNKTIDPISGKIILQMVGMAPVASLPKGKVVLAKINFTPKTTGEGVIGYSGPVELVGTTGQSPVLFTVSPSQYSLKIAEKKSLLSIILSIFKIKR